MSTQKKKKYRTEEEILEILAEAEKYGPAKTARNRSINPSLISNWKKKFRNESNSKNELIPRKPKTTYQLLTVPEKQNSKIALMITDDREALIEILKGL